MPGTMSRRGVAREPAGRHATRLFDGGDPALAGVVPAALLRQPVQALGAAQRTEDLLGRFAVAARRLARALGRQPRRLAGRAEAPFPYQKNKSSPPTVEHGVRVASLTSLADSRVKGGLPMTDPSHLVRESLLPHRQGARIRRAGRGPTPTPVNATDDRMTSVLEAHSDDREPSRNCGPSSPP